MITTRVSVALGERYEALGEEDDADAAAPALATLRRSMRADNHEGGTGPAGNLSH
jgi:hypothetical protein